MGAEVKADSCIGQRVAVGVEALEFQNVMGDAGSISELADTEGEVWVTGLSFKALRAPRDRFGACA